MLRPEKHFLEITPVEFQILSGVNPEEFHVLLKVTAEEFKVSPVGWVWILNGIGHYEKKVFIRKGTYGVYTSISEPVMINDFDSEGAANDESVINQDMFKI